MNLAAALILTALITLTAILPVAVLATLITPEDAARLTAHLLRSIAGLATFIPRYLSALAAELFPDPPDEHAFTHNGDRYVYRGVSTPAEPTTQPTRQPPPKRP